MADPTSSAEESTDRRDRRRDRKRRKTRRLAGTVAGIVAVAAVALIASDLVRLSGEDKPSLAGTVETTVERRTAHSVTTTTSARNCRPLATTDPLRLWVGGDSLAGSLGPELGKLAGATGIVQPYFDSRVSSGLFDPGFFDWPGHGTTEMTRLDPDVAVFIIGANDWAAVSGDWKDAYTAKVDSMMKTLVGSDRTVYWLGSPILQDQKMDDAVLQVNAVQQEVAKRHPQVHYVDTYKLFSDTDGTFAYNLPDENGTLTTMRAGDGVHLTIDGADYLARQVYKLIDAQCGVTEQKVDGVTKQTIESEGSTQVAPGSNNSSGSGSSGSSGGSDGSGGTIQTTPPATAPTTSPPEAAPPVTEPATTLPSATTTPPIISVPSGASTP